MCSSTRIQLFLKTENFSVLVFCPHVNGAVGTINTVFKKRSPEWIFASIILDSSLIVDGRKTEVFEFDNVIHHILIALRILCKGCYRNFIVLICFLFCFVSSIFNQHKPFHRFFELAILCGETIAHNDMFSAVIADPFVFRK